MNSLKAFFTASFLAFFLFVNTAPQALAIPNQIGDSLPEIHGEAAYLIDVQSGQTLYAKNGDKLLAPASTTKIMTGLLAIEHGNLDDIVTASNTMLNYKIVYGTRIYLEPGEQLTLRELLYALLLHSANDAAVAIAEHIAGDIPHFAEMMNNRAKDMGLKNTTFKNPSGLTEEGHLTTAHDLAKIALNAYQNPIFAEIVRTKTYTIPRTKKGVPTVIFNENKLLWRDSSITGIKTGYTAAAGNCLVASAARDGRELIGVILKSPGGEIYNDMQKLLDYGFEQFSNTVYIPSGTSVSTFLIHNEQVNLVLDQPVWITKRKGGPEPVLLLKVQQPDTRLSQVEAGQKIAKVEIWESGELLRVLPLNSDRSVKPSPSVKTSFALTPYLTLALVGSTIILAYKKYLAAKKYRQMRLNRRRESNP